MTPEQLAEALRLHSLWLDEDPVGKHSYLSGANLRGANLRNANLSGANLRGAKGVIRIGPSSDGYEFFGVQRDGVVWIKAGCRWLTADDARKHWQASRADTQLGRERLRFVDFIDAHFKEDV